MSSPDYSTLEELLFRGFLTSPVYLGETPVVLKSLNESELEVLNLRCPSERTNWRVRTSWMLAYSTFLFNRANALVDRDELLHKLADVYSELPLNVIISLLTETYRLNETTRAEMSHVQPYSFGPESRRRWNMYDGAPLNSVSVTGIEGSETLSLNAHQSLWLYFNRMDDLEESFDRQWEVAKFVASAQAPKGVRRISNKDKQKREKKRKRREALHRGKGEIKYGAEDEIHVVDETPEELMAQMEKSVRGEKDYHDRVVEAYEARMRDQYSKKKAERQQRSEKRREERRDKMQSVSKDLPYVVYTEDEVEEEINRNEERRWKRFDHAAQHDPPAFRDPEAQERLRKWNMMPDDVEEEVDSDDPFEHPLLRDTWTHVEEEYDGPDD